MSKRRLDPRPMPKQEPAERVRNFGEVALGYTVELAPKKPHAAWLQEAAASPAARWDRHPGFIGHVATGDSPAAVRISSGPTPAGRLRPGLPAGDPVRARLHPGQEGRPGGIGRLERFVADWERGEGRQRLRRGRRPSGTQRGRRRLGAGRHHGGRRSGRARLRRHHVRGAARSRRRAHLRHPRVPPAQGHRPPRGRLRAQPGRRAAPRLRRRQDAHDRRAAARRSTRSSWAPAPGCPGSSTSPART